MASKPFVLSDLNVTQCSWICFYFSPSLIKKHSMVTADITAGFVFIRADEEYLSSVSLQSDINIRLQHGLHVRTFLRLLDTELSYVALNSVNILLPFNDLFFFVFFKSIGERIQSFLKGKNLVVFYLYNLSFLSLSIISGCFLRITALTGLVLKILFSALIPCSLLFWLLFWIFGQRLNPVRC